jgi:galactokinase
MNALADRVSDAFKRAFGARPSRLVMAPGRVNLIGEHTDYNDGFVLPCAITAGTIVALAPRTDDRIAIIAADYGDARDEFAVALPIQPGRDGWMQHARGVVAALLGRGHRVTGADIVVGGDVPQGAGLSSSASFGVALATALVPELALTQAALVAQAAENDFVGTACGTMDQLVSAHARAGHATLIDCRALTVHHVAIPHDVGIAIVHSGIARGLVDTAYNERRRQCEAAAGLCGIPALRDADLAMLEAAGLDIITLKRARHVVSENARTLAAAEALPRADLAALGALMRASHASMRDDFEISTPRIDALVAMANDALGDAGGARMTGGGFGGCVVLLGAPDRLDHALAVVRRDYSDPGGAPPRMWRVSPTQGVHRLDDQALANDPQPY